MYNFMSYKSIIRYQAKNFYQASEFSTLYNFKISSKEFLSS